MEISTIVILSVVAFLVISITVTAIRHFRAKRSKDDLRADIEDFWDIRMYPGDAIADFEPIKSHIEVMREAERTRDALYNAIDKNLRDHKYVPRCKHPELQHWRCKYELPDLLELQNVISLKPIIKDLEDQYKRFEEAMAIAKRENEFTDTFIQNVLEKLKEDQTIKELISSRGIDKSDSPNRDLFDLLGSPECKEIIERTIDEEVKAPQGEV